MEQTDASTRSSELDILALNSDIVRPLAARTDQPYSLRMHNELYDEVNPEFPREFMEIAAQPLFQDFSTGRPNYSTETDPELLGTDLSILRNFHEYVEANRDSITHPADIDVKMQFLGDYTGEARQERAARYAMEVARRLEHGEGFEAVEGMQITTPYDFRDVMEVLDERGHQELPQADEADIFVRYGPDEMSFNDEDFGEAHEIRRALNDRYQDREYLNKGEPPVMELLSEDE